MRNYGVKFDILCYNINGALCGDFKLNLHFDYFGSPILFLEYFLGIAETHLDLSDQF